MQVVGGGRQLKESICCCRLGGGWVGGVGPSESLDFRFKTFDLDWS